MATYREIKGFTIQSLSSDPAADANTEGQVWYNTTSNTLKGITTVTGAGAWAAGGALSGGDKRNATGIGGQTAALCVMGTPSGGYPAVDTSVETYDGSTWTAAPSANTARTNMGSNAIGSQAAGQVMGGYTPGPTLNVISEQFNGTAWAEVGDLNTGRWSGAGGGTITAGFYVGGRPGTFNNSEIYNGLAWTAVNTLQDGRGYLSGGGPTTAGLVFGGGTPETTLGKQTESWNGTSWSEVSDLNTARMYAAGICGTAAQTSSLYVGGQTPSTIGSVEQWNGTSWTEVADLTTARTQLTGNSAASTTAGLVVGGNSPASDATEEWTVASPSIAVKTFTSS